MNNTKYVLLQWGSETGSRRWPPNSHDARRRPSCFNGAPRLGLGDGINLNSRGVKGERASMGLRDWVSEMARCGRWCPSPACRFNGAPRLGLGDGEEVEDDKTFFAALQWGSETGSRRWQEAFRAPQVEGESFNGAPRLGLGDGAGRGPVATALPESFNGAPRLGLGDGMAGFPTKFWPLGFNGAPRLGLGDGLCGWSPSRTLTKLQWGSETGSRRWQSPCRPTRSPRASPRFNGAPRLGLGDGRQPTHQRGSPGRTASMGLRDWVSEMGSEWNPPEEHESR